MIGTDQDNDGSTLNEAGGKDGSEFGMYNNLEALASNYNLATKQFFILPEFQKFQHTFKKLNSNLITRLTDQNILESARYLELNYR